MHIRRLIEAILGQDIVLGFGDHETFRHWCVEGAVATIDTRNGDYFCSNCGMGDLTHLYMGRFRCGIDIARDALLYASLNKCKVPSPEFVVETLRGNVPRKSIAYKAVSVTWPFVMRCHEALLRDRLFQAVIFEKMNISLEEIMRRRLGVIHWSGPKARVRWWLVIPRVRQDEVTAVDLRNPFSMMRIRFLPSASGGVQYRKRLLKKRGRNAPKELGFEDPSREGLKDGPALR